MRGLSRLRSACPPRWTRPRSCVAGQRRPGLCRAKGVVDLRLDGGVTVPATVQYAAGRLGFEPAPEGEERYLVFIGTDISLPEAPSS